MIKLRDYQSRAMMDVFKWWEDHPGTDEIPLIELPTAAGKSVICAAIVSHMFDQWPEYEPRTVILVPSKELAQQNAEKLTTMLPSTIHVGFVSASLGKKQHHADVIVATIGSIAKSAHLLGNIKCVIVDECHLVNSKDAGMYRKFLSSLAKYCDFRTVGMTATPFRGNGVWLTDGDEPLFTGIASRVTMHELLDQGFITPLVPPEAHMVTRIDSSMVGIANGDYKIGELSSVVAKYLRDVSRETVKLAVDRSKWIAFTPSVLNANALRDNLIDIGINCAVVCGDTPKPERDALVGQFRRGELRCLVTVLALAIGFDVPDVDCIIWCRPTKSPVLYVQGMGRGVRISEGKQDCLVLDFTDTVERLGPVDTVRGRAKSKKVDQDAPHIICDACGERNHAKALICVHCGAVIREEVEEAKIARASTAELISKLRAPTITWHEVTRVDYKVHHKENKPDSLRVDYYSGLLRVASEWVCFDHTGYARQKAEAWWSSRWTAGARGEDLPDSVDDAITILDRSGYGNEKRGFTYPEHPEDPDGVIFEPTHISTRKNGKFTEIVSHAFDPSDVTA